MAEVGARLMASLRYATALFDGATAERLLAQLATLLAGVAAAPETPVAELPLLPAAERRRLVTEWNPAPLAGEGACLHELVAAQAARTPGAEALVGGERRLTYRQLDGAANRLARRLRELGVGPESPAGVCMARGPEMVVALLGVLKAGGVYVPLDPDYPRERLAFTLDDSRVRVLLVHGEAPALPVTAAPVVDLADFRPEDGGETAPPPSGVVPGNLAYLIYTSGSTGKPKGVAITHAAAAAMVRWAGGVFPEGELRGVMAATSICFDLSVFEIFVPLAHGGRVIVAANALELPALPAAGEVTLVNTVPSAMGELAAGALPACVRVVNLAGEPLARDLVDRIYRHGGVDKVCNLYGPSEDTTYSTYARIERGEARPPSIGRPIAGTQVYLVDRALGLAPQGAVGELLLGGAGLARGYLARPALSAERFVPDAFSGRPGERLYRTGDLARYRADADLEFLGRADHQVKVRGFRIELGEIETALRRHVREAVVVARADAAGDQQIVAYVAAGAELDAGALRRALGDTLPAFMVPQTIVVLEALPLTPNGKVDRKALPAPEADQAVHDRRFVAPETEVEEMLAAIWREVLGVDEIGIYDRFFDLGGHSLKAMRVLSRVREAFQVDLPVRALLEAPTIAGLEEAIARALMEEAGEEAVAEILAEIE
jgi:amino acid adenylation domain-containing protein